MFFDIQLCFYVACSIVQAIVNEEILVCTLNDISNNRQ